MKLIDTHAHIYHHRFKDDIDDVIRRAQDAGVEKIYMPNIDSESIDSMLELEQRFPDFCIPTMGLHPCHVTKDFEKELYIVEDWLAKRHFVAVGEMGTDLYWDKTNLDLQIQAFNIQCDLAIKYNIPIIIHCRESIAETINLVSEIDNKSLRGIFHCVSGSVEQARQIIDMKFLIGLGGVATFKNGGLDEVIEQTDLKHVVLETDSPFLAPVPFRGKRNEPAYITEVAKKIADIKEISMEEVGDITTRSASKIYENAC